MNMVQVIQAFASWFSSLFSMLHSHLYFYDADGNRISWLGIIFACVVLSAVVNLFFKGARG